MRVDEHVEVPADGRASGVRPPETPGATDLFRLAMAQSGVGILLSDGDGCFLDVNAAAAQMAGRTVAEMVGLSPVALSLPEDHEAIRASLGEVYDGGLDNYSARRRWLRPDGTIVRVHVTVSAVRDVAGSTVGLLAQAVDVTELHEAREEARVVEAALRGVIDSLIDPWVLLGAVRDSDGHVVDFRFLDANSAACTANGMDRETMLGTTLLTLLPAHAETELFDLYVRVVESGEPLELDDSPFRRDPRTGRLGYFDNRAVRVGDGLSFTWRDVTERVEQRQRLSRQAMTDPLTGLANRARLMDALEDACTRAPASGCSGALLYCDLDGLKRINDTLGHEAGDIVLRTVADRMRGAVRSIDVVARFGGDEFVVLATGVVGDDAALAFALKVADAVTRPLLLGGIEIVPTISTGVAVAWPGCTPSELLRVADDALYREKRRRSRPATTVAEA